MPIDFEKYYIHDDIEPATESYFKSTDDLIINMDRWENGTNKILFITGLSGSGKSTLGKEMLEKYNNAELITLDFLTIKQLRGADFLPKSEIVHPLIIEYANTHTIRPAKSFNDESSIEEIRNFVSWMTIEINKPKWNNKRFILEGTQVFLALDAEYLHDKPLIIKGTSALISFIRAGKRDKIIIGKDGDWKEVFCKKMKRLLQSINKIKGRISDQNLLDNLIKELKSYDK